MTLGSRAVLLTAVAVLWALSIEGVALGRPPSTVLVSRATGAHGPKMQGPWLSTRLSADGRSVGFADGAVFVRDLATSTTSLVSLADGVDGAMANGGSDITGISGDGRSVLFGSTATNLDPADTDQELDVYVRDLDNADTVLVSRADGNGEKANAAASRSRISASGRFVAFTSKATNLDPADVDPDSDVFVRDLVTKQTRLATPGIDGPVLAALSGDGTHIAYTVSDSAGSDPTDRGALYVRNLVTGAVALAARADGPDGTVANGSTVRISVSLSTDGRYVSFTSGASNLDPADRDTKPDAYVRDLVSNETTLASRADGPGGAKADEAAYAAVGSLSADGRYLAFTTGAGNLDPLDDRFDDESDVYVRDLRRNETTLASVSAVGRKGDLSSSDPFLSGDGRYVAFLSEAENLTPDAGDITSDINSEPFTDVFVHDLRAPRPVAGRPPRSRIDAVRRRKFSYLVLGHARDDHGLLNVDVSLTRRYRTAHGYRCEAARLTSEGDFWVPTARRGGRCLPRFDIQATSGPRWRARVPGEIADGTYTLTSRATDTGGQHERRFSRARGNVKTFRVPG